MMDVTNPKLVEHVANRFRALGDENRIRLLARLAKCPANVRTLTEDLRISQAAASKHLSVLRRAGLVTYEAKGPQSIYRISDPSVEKLCGMVCQGVLEFVRREARAINDASIN